MSGLWEDFKEATRPLRIAVYETALRQEREDRRNHKAAQAARYEKAESSGRYTRNPQVISAFREVWNHAFWQGRETQRSGMLNFSQSSGAYKNVIAYNDEAAKITVTLRRAGSPQNRDYEEYFAKQNGQWLDENSRSVTLRSGWLKVYAVYNSQLYPAFVRFDRGQAADLIRLSQSLTIAP